MGLFVWFLHCFWDCSIFFSHTCLYVFLALHHIYIWSILLLHHIWLLDLCMDIRNPFFYCTWRVTWRVNANLNNLNNVKVLRNFCSLARECMGMQVLLGSVNFLKP